jgi:NAD(P)H-dependent FMN reductase
MSKPKIAIIISSTRPTRFADKPAAWLVEQAKKRDDFDFEVLDLRDYKLPFFAEMASNAWMPSQDSEAQRWQKKLAEFDGYLVLVAEYNRSMTAALKNAFDQAAVEWAKKPIATMGYGSMGATSAIQHIRAVAVELQMVSCRNAVYIGGSDFFKVSPLGANGPMSEIEDALLPGAKAMFDDLVWWADATISARADDLKAAA